MVSRRALAPVAARGEATKPDDLRGLLVHGEPSGASRGCRLWRSH
jgi:hypothetical protein